MSNKIFIIIFVLIGCTILYAFSIIHIKNKVINLEMQATDLEEKYAILKNQSNSIMEEIGYLLSMTNLNKVAIEKNFKRPTKEQIIELTNDKNKTK